MANIEYKSYGSVINNTSPSQHLTDSKYIQGSFYVVNSSTELNSLPKKTAETAEGDGIIINGCLAYNTADSKFYQYNGTTWVEKTFGTPITITTTSGSESISDGTNTLNVATRDTTQTITGEKTFSGLNKFKAANIKLLDFYGQDYCGVIDVDDGCFGFSDTLSLVTPARNNSIILDTYNGAIKSKKNGASSYTTYTLPSQSGTLALTSNLSSYLPLSGGTMTGDIDFSNSSSWIKPYLLAFKNADTSQSPTYPYTGFYQWGNEWQVNARDASNTFVHNLLTINNSTKIATFSERPTVNGSNIALVSDISTNYLSYSSNVVSSGSTKNYILGKQTTSSNSSTYYNSNVYFTNAGELTVNTLNLLSDARLKENLAAYNPSKSILDLPVYTFDFKDSDLKNQIGCLAQDLQEIEPRLVDATDDGYLHIRETKLVYLLLNEVKKLNNKINDLTTELTNLKSEE